MAGTIDLGEFATADDASVTFMPARPSAERARPTPGAEEAAQRAAGAVHEQRQTAQRRAAATRTLGRGVLRRSEILAGWLLVLALLLGIAAWSLVATDRGDPRDIGVGPIPRGGPAVIGPDTRLRDDLADPRTHDDE